MWNSIRQALTLGPRFRSHARKPGLEVYFDPTSTYERRDVADTGDRPGYFCHVMVRNDGPVAARNCRGRLLEIQVRGADLKDGLLSIALRREIPEAMKPRKIDIGGSQQRGEQGAIGSDRKPASGQTVDARAEEHA